MAVEREMFRSTPAGLRSFHGPLPISPQWKRAVRPVDQLRGEAIGPQLKPVGLEYAGIKSEFGSQQARAVRGRRDRAASETRPRNIAPRRGDL